MLVALVLLCGLPGAGKTSLARELERLAAASDRSADWRVERLSFDDLYLDRLGSASSDADFEPTGWKRCQVAMAASVREWGAQIAEAPGELTDARRLVLVLDDNFQLRSLRKRFARLAAEANCGFGILSVETPEEICRERNAARGSGRERVPEHAFERMARAFEAPDGRRHPFERNTRTLRGQEGALADSSSSAVWDALEELVSAADALRVEARRLAALEELDQQQRTLDQIRANQDVVHQVDLQLRKWISSTVRSSEQLNTSSSAKAALAQRLNQQRKDFLAQLKTGSAAAGGGGSDAVDAHVQSFFQFALEEVAKS